MDAELVRDYMAGFGDEDAYGIANIGWAMNENAKWGSLATDRRGHGMEARGFAGNVLFSTGPNTQAGGPNNTACHLDIPMRGCSLYLDAGPSSPTAQSSPTSCARSQPDPQRPAA